MLIVNSAVEFNVEKTVKLQDWSKTQNSCFTALYQLFVAI